MTVQFCLCKWLKFRKKLHFWKIFMVFIKYFLFVFLCWSLYCQDCLDLKRSFRSQHWNRTGYWLSGQGFENRIEKFQWRKILKFEPVFESRTVSMRFEQDWNTCRKHDVPNRGTNTNKHKNNIDLPRCNLYSKWQHSPKWNYYEEKKEIKLERRWDLRHLHN